MTKVHDRRPVRDSRAIGTLPAGTWFLHIGTLMLLTDDGVVVNAETGRRANWSMEWLVDPVEVEIEITKRIDPETV